MMYRYILYEEKGLARKPYAYGLLRQKRQGDGWSTVALAHHFLMTRPVSNSSQNAAPNASSIPFIFLTCSTTSWTRRLELSKKMLRPNSLVAASFYAYYTAVISDRVQQEIARRCTYHARFKKRGNTDLLTCVRERNAPAPTSYLLTGRPCNGELSSRRIKSLRRGLTRTAPFRVGLPAFFLRLSCPRTGLCGIGMYYGMVDIQLHSESSSVGYLRT